MHIELLLLRFKWILCLNFPFVSRMSNTRDHKFTATQQHAQSTCFQSKPKSYSTAVVTRSLGLFFFFDGTTEVIVFLGPYASAGNLIGLYIFFQRINVFFDDIFFEKTVFLLCAHAHCFLSRFTGLVQCCANFY